MENPLLIYKNDTNDSFIRFDLIKDEHFEPAFEAALATARENLKKIIENSESPTFENTIEAIEYVSEDLDRINSIFSVYKESLTSSELARIAQNVLPKLSEFDNDIVLSHKLFERVKSFYESTPKLSSKEKNRLLEKTYKEFVRNGALLSDSDKQILRDHDVKLATLSQTFAENLLNATNKYELHITNEADLSGIPERTRLSAREEAESRNKEGWVFTLKETSVIPFVQYANNAKLRKEIVLASGKRAMSGEFDNRQIVLDITRFRKERAQLLGYSSHAHFVLEDRMAKTPENVKKFFDELFEVAQPLASKDFEMLRSYKEKLSGDTLLYPWDVAYYEDKLKKEKFNFDEEILRPYFELETVLLGLFKHATVLYGLVFTERKDIPVYHKDVRVFEARNETGQYAGLFYLDLFPRDSKRGGAWADMVRSQIKKDGIDIRPHVFVTCNFTRPTEIEPSLLTFDQVWYMFHEFGHALHVLLSNCQYSSLTGFNTLLDFVELPSQLLQEWPKQKEGLDIFARHYQTGETISDSLYKGLSETNNFMEAWTTMGQLSGAALDLEWHKTNLDILDVESFENEVTKRYKFFEAIPGVSLSTRFKHIFNGGYDVGYYSYHWAEVLAADAFEYFKENGLFSKEIAEKFRANVLSKGNTEEPLELYRAFRGRDADPKALFRLKGLI